MAVQLAIAFDGSPSATIAVRTTGALFPGARAAVVTVPAPPPPGVRNASRWLMQVPAGTFERVLSEIDAEAKEDASELAEEGAEQARAAGLDATPVVVRPHEPAWEVLLASTKDADLLVCGARGRSELARTVLGSTSTSLLHHAELPLLVVPDDVGKPGGPIVIAYDGSDAANHAIDVAARLLPGRPAIVVHVWESQYRRSRSVRAVARGEVGELVSALDKALADEAAAVIEEGVNRARNLGLQATGEAVEAGAGVWRTVAEYVRSAQAGLVVTGARGVGGARSALLGSVSSGLVYNADTPVLVVHAP
jgi:nucleotide-binding universal stress UspA family protein